MHAAFYFRACNILNRSLYIIYYTRVLYCGWRGELSEEARLDVD